MLSGQDTDRSAIAPAAPACGGGPRWRALLEARWRERLQEVTELSLAYHAAGDPVPGRAGQQEQRQQEQRQQEQRQLLRRAVSARRRLADTEDALGRLAAGYYGCCEQCGAQIRADLLTIVPETRYCTRCGVMG